MYSRPFKILTILAVTALVASCKLEIVAIQGGDIEWTGGSCPEGSNCVVEITDPNYSNTFTVTPKAGYEFVKWHKGAGFLCGDAANLACTVTMPNDSSGAAAIISVFETGYIMPVYRDVGIDTDNDGYRNELDADDDNDGLEDSVDNCPYVPAGSNGDGCEFPDADLDGIADAQDNCPNATNSNQSDHDSDSIGDACDPDDDNDGVVDLNDCVQYSQIPLDGMTPALELLEFAPGISCSDIDHWALTFGTPVWQATCGVIDSTFMQIAIQQCNMD